MSWQWQDYAAGSGQGYDYMASSSSSYKKTQTSQPRQNREQHMERLEIWLCKICNKEFASKSGLNRHFTMIHDEQPKPKQKAIKDAPRAMVQYREDTERIVCNICDKDYASQSNLTRHLNTVHQVHEKAANTVTKNKLVQKKTTNIVINMYKPAFYGYNNEY